MNYGFFLGNEGDEGVAFRGISGRTTFLQQNNVLNGFVGSTFKNIDWGFSIWWAENEDAQANSTPGVSWVKEQDSLGIRLGAKNDIFSLGMTLGLREESKASASPGRKEPQTEGDGGVLFQRGQGAARGGVRSFQTTKAPRSNCSAAEEAVGVLQEIQVARLDQGQVQRRAPVHPERPQLRLGPRTQGS